MFPVHPEAEGLLEGAPRLGPGAKIAAGPQRGDPPRLSTFRGAGGSPRGARSPGNSAAATISDLRQHHEAHGIACWAVTGSGSWEAGGTLEQ